MLTGEIVALIPRGGDEGDQVYGPDLGEVAEGGGSGLSTCKVGTASLQDYDCYVLGKSDSRQKMITLQMPELERAAERVRVPAFYGGSKDWLQFLPEYNLKETN